MNGLSSQVIAMPKTKVKKDVASKTSSVTMQRKQKKSKVTAPVEPPEQPDSDDDVANEIDDMDGFGADNEDFSGSDGEEDSEFSDLDGDIKAEPEENDNSSDEIGDEVDEFQHSRSAEQRDAEGTSSIKNTKLDSGDNVSESGDIAIENDVKYSLTKTCDTRAGPRPGLIRNKMKRHEIYKEQLLQKRKDRKVGREKRKREREELGENAPKTKDPRTIENTREFDETIVDPDDEEVIRDQETDELSSYFDGRPPKIIVTTSNKPVGETFRFAEALINIMPTAEFRPRKVRG